MMVLSVMPYGAMENEYQSDVGNLVSVLSLDIAAPLHSALGVPSLEGGHDARPLLKDILRAADLPRFDVRVFPHFAARFEATENDAEHRVLEWIATAFGGSHPANPELSAWLLAKHWLRGAVLAGDAPLAVEPAASLTRFLDLADLQIDREAFGDKLEEMRLQSVMTDWDRELHVRKRWVQGDDLSGRDPFLPLKFANAGEGLRRAIALSDLDRDPHFPHARLRTLGQRFLEENAIWMPDGVDFPDLRRLVR